MKNKVFGVVYSAAQCGLMFRLADHGLVAYVPSLQSVDVLLHRGVVMFCSNVGHFRSSPLAGGRFVKLTERGRGVVAVLLAREAEALVAAGCADPRAKPIRTVPDVEALVDGVKLYLTAGS